MLMLTVCMPSRGLIHSRTIEEVLELNLPIKFTHDLPIPACFNWFVQNVSGDLLFIEEDMHIPPNLVSVLSNSSADIVTFDYPLRGGMRCVQNINGFTLGGTGCTMIKRKVFDEIGLFRVNTEYDARTLEPRKIVKEKIYGKHDIDFYIRAQQAGFSVEVVGDVGHYVLLERGEERTNKGWHKITELE